MKYSREAVKELLLRRLRLTPSTQGRGEGDVPSVIRSIGGLQYGGHLIELFNRFRGFRPSWFDRWYAGGELVEGHVLRGALRIVNADEYARYFKATRCVARRRRYQNCPASLTRAHDLALRLLSELGPLTLSEFREAFGERHPDWGERAGRLLLDLYNHGEVARAGRRRSKPLYHDARKLPNLPDASNITEGEAMEWLVSKCLGIYGPFSVGDVAHWAGWNQGEARTVIQRLLEAGEVVAARIEGEGDELYMRAEDEGTLASIEGDLPDHEFVRVLFNDDALLLGYLPRLGERLGFDWRYPQLSEGVVWKAGILYGRELIGEAVVEMYAGSKAFRVTSSTFREGYDDPGVIGRVREELRRHAEFQDKQLEIEKTESNKVFTR